MTGNARWATVGRLIMGAVLGGSLGGLLACAASPDTPPEGSGGSGMMTAGGGGAGAGTSGGAGGPGTSKTNVDDGSLFHDAGSAASILADASGPAATSEGGTTTTRDAGGSAFPGDGNSATGKVLALGVRALFTQKGADVTVVITATRCPAGMHTLTIHEGYACDDPTRGPVWGGGKRGGGIPPVVCDATQQGTLTYTRTGSDPSTNWTVADHNQTTDVTLHPLMMDSQCGTFF
jgi:hypothetical protein